jgi:hypothetical protein
MGQFSKWIFIVFLWGGLGVTIWWLRCLKKTQGELSADIPCLRSALRILLVFIILAAFGFLNLFTVSFGTVRIQTINNLLTSVVFLMFLVTLKKALRSKGNS